MRTPRNREGKTAQKQAAGLPDGVLGAWEAHGHRWAAVRMLKFFNEQMSPHARAVCEAFRTRCFFFCLDRKVNVLRSL